MQTKLAISQPGDAYEQEAERMADAVMRMPSSEQRPSPAVSHLQRRATNTNTAGDTSAVANALASVSQSLDPGTRTFFESRIGHDFSRVRIHADTRAAESTAAVGAQAYTVGEDIAFAANQYDPASTAGRHLLAHELTHVVQQTSGGAATHIARKQTPWPAWHQEVLNAISGIAGLSDGKDADAKWPQFAAFLCKLTQARAASLYQRLGSTAEGLIGGTDDFAIYLRAKFPTHHARMHEILAEIARGVMPIECRPQKKQNDEETRKKKQAAQKRPNSDTDNQRIYNGVCGPNITNKLNTVILDVKSSFKGANAAEKQLSCDALLFPLTAPFAWEITQLFDRQWISLYSGCATGECKDTVEVSDECHDPAAVNFVLWGTTCRLCHDFLKAGTGGLVDPFKYRAYSESSMLAIIGLWKKLPGKTNEAGAKSWGSLGWRGFHPSRAVAGQAPQCEASCDEIGAALEWTWIPLKAPAKIKELKGG